MQLLLLMYQREQNLPTWQMFEGSVSVLNEEAGGTSFSLLARVVLGDCLKAEFPHMNQMYKMTRQYSKVTDEIVGEQGRSRRHHGYTLLNDKNQEILTVGVFMLEKIRAITLNSFTEYTGQPKPKNPAYDVNANLTQPYTKEHRFWIPDIIPLCLRTMAKYREACTGTWAEASGLHEFWPTFHNPLRVAAVQGNHQLVMEERERRNRIASGAADGEEFKDEDTEDDDDSEYEDAVVRVPGGAIQKKGSQPPKSSTPAVQPPAKKPGKVAAPRAPVKEKKAPPKKKGRSSKM